MTNLPALLKSIRDIMREDTGLNGDAQRIEQLGWMLFFKVFSDKDKELELLDDHYRSPIPAHLHWDAWAADPEGITGDELLRLVDGDLFPTLRNLDVTGAPRAAILREVFTGNFNYMKSGTALRRVLAKLAQIDFNIARDRHAFGELYESILKELQSAGKSGEFYTPRAVTTFLADRIAPRTGEVVLDPACGTGGFLTAAAEILKAQAGTVDERRAVQENIRGWELKPLPYLLAVTNLILHDLEVPRILHRDALENPLSSYGPAARVDCILANPPFGGTVGNGAEQNFPQSFRTKESADLFLVLIIHLLKPGGRAAIVLPDGSLTGEGVKARVRERLLKECNLHTVVRLPNSVFQPYATVATNLLFFTKAHAPSPTGEGRGGATKEVWYYEHRLPEGVKAYSKTKTIRREEFAPLEVWWDAREESEVAWRVPIETIEARGWDLDIKNPHRAEEVGEKSSAEILAELEESFARSTDLLARIKEEVGV